MARKMKDSGIEWIGEIPEGWEVAPLKRFASIQTGNTPSKTSDSNYYASTGIPWIKPDNLGYSYSISKTSEYLSSEGALCARIMPPNTVYVCCIGSLGKVGYSSISCACNQQINALIFNDLMFWKYGYYLTIAQESQYLLFGNGNVLQIINSTSQGNIACVLPPLENQHLIACYLDSVCSDIEVLISKARSSIEEYKKLKQTVITQAVTKGVCGKREMKDSGVEWIGEIPVEWNITKIKSGVTKIGSGKTPSGGAETYTDSGVIFLRSQNVYDCTLNLKSPTYISHEVDATMKSTRVFPDDVLLNITGGSIGRCSIVPKTLGLANVNQHVCIIRTNPLIFLPKYMQYFWVSALGHLAIDLYQTGGNREGMSADAIRNTPIPYAPLKEQKEIAAYLDTKCAEIDGLIVKKEQLVKELESYKKSLIYEVVTGKREV